LQRRVPSDGSASLRIALRHSAERRRTPTTATRALTIKANQATAPAPEPTLTKAELENKLVASQLDGIILPSQKFFNIRYTDTVTPNGEHKFPATPPADEAAARAQRVADTDTTTTNDLKSYLTNVRTSPQWNYTVTDPEGYSALAPPYVSLAAVGNRYDADLTIDGTTLTFPYLKALFPAGTPATYTVPMATSVQLMVNGPMTTTATYPNGVPAMLISDDGALDVVRQFGFNFLFGDSTSTIEAFEDVLTVDQSFYRTGYGAANADAISGSNVDNTFYTLDSRTLDDFPISAAGSNTLAFRFDPRAEPYFNANNNARIPYYRLSRLKTEIATFDNADRQLSALAPSHTINVNAFVYAQEGSWFVIPGDYFEDVRRDWVNAPGPTSGPGAATAAKQTGENLDLNRDGITTETERVAVYRYSRYNYKIAFKGAIMENKSAVVVNAGTINGDVQDWTDKWVNTTLTPGNFPGGVLDHTGIKYGDGEEMQIISYQFDPVAADPNNVLDNDTGFNPPVNSELIYESG